MDYTFAGRWRMLLVNFVTDALIVLSEFNFKYDLKSQ